MVTESVLWDWWIRGLGGAANYIAAFANDGPPITRAQLDNLKQWIATLSHTANRLEKQYQERTGNQP